MMAKQELKKQREPEKLHERYGKIGISAVVAALTYQMPKISLTPPSRPATTSGTKKRRDQRSSRSLAIQNARDDALGGLP
jgi:hypothetical protein